MPAMICGQGFTCGKEVQAQRNRPGGRRKPPRIIGGRRASGAIEEVVVAERVRRKKVRDQ